MGSNGQTSLDLLGTMREEQMGFESLLMCTDSDLAGLGVRKVRGRRLRLGVIVC